MSGRLTVIGLGPGNADQVTPQASRAVAEAKFFYGYKPYLDRLELRADQTRVASDNREELARSKDALLKAAEGHAVAVVSGGDPGVFAMAAAVCEAIEAGPAAWRAVDVAAALVEARGAHAACPASSSDDEPDTAWLTLSRRMTKNSPQVRCTQTSRAGPLGLSRM
jgi:precorrin-3B C17-methyltransferase